MSKTYAVKETFRTIQGEGHHAGTPALFIRFAGCNMWSGLDKDRDRDAAKNGAKCPLWCDTDFVDGEKTTLMDLRSVIDGQNAVPLIVLTGGEPLLQVDDALLTMLWNAAPEACVAIETNGTEMPRFDLTPSLLRTDPKLWITLSPKRSRADTRLGRANELKLVWPSYDPTEWMNFPAQHYWLSPQAGKDYRDAGVEAALAAKITGGFRWKLSMQLHKILGVR